MKIKSDRKVRWRWKNDISDFKEDILLKETPDRLSIRYICCPIATINPKKSEIEYYFPQK